MTVADEAVQRGAGRLGELTYIVPVRLREPSRRANAMTVVRWACASFPEARVLVAEQDYEPALRLEGDPPGPGEGGVEHLFLRDHGPFDKGWVNNCAARRSTRRYVAFGDADVVVARAQLLAALGLLGEREVVKPFHRAQVLDVDAAGAERFAQTLDVRGIAGMEGRGMTNLAGGLFVAERAAFLDLGGFPEGFEGWGGEDDAMGLLLETFLRWAELPGPALHLPHPRPAPDPAGYAANVARLLQIARTPVEDLARWNARRRAASGDPTRPRPARWVAPS
jgi:hypothetical protein